MTQNGNNEKHFGKMTNRVKDEIVRLNTRHALEARNYHSDARFKALTLPRADTHPDPSERNLTVTNYQRQSYNDNKVNFTTDREQCNALVTYKDNSLTQYRQPFDTQTMRNNTSAKPRTNEKMSGAYKYRSFNLY